MDVWAFKTKTLGNLNDHELFNGNQHLLQIYHAQPNHANHAQPNAPQPNVYGGRARRARRTRRTRRARGRKGTSHRARK